MLGVDGKFLMVRLRAQTTRIKTSVLAIIFRLQMANVSPYLNPHISAESCRMKTTRRPYFTETLRRSIFRFKKKIALIFNYNIYDGVMITSPQQASSCS